MHANVLPYLIYSVADACKRTPTTSPGKLQSGQKGCQLAVENNVATVLTVAIIGHIYKTYNYLDRDIKERTQHCSYKILYGKLKG